MANLKHYVNLKVVQNACQAYRGYGNYLMTKSNGQSSQDILFLIPISFTKRSPRNTELDRIGLFYWSFHLLHFHLSFYSRTYVKGKIVKPMATSALISNDKYDTLGTSTPLMCQNKTRNHFAMLVPWHWY